MALIPASAADTGRLILVLEILQSTQVLDTLHSTQVLVTCKLG
jgi:hypothetical protein